MNSKTARLIIDGFLTCVGTSRAVHHKFPNDPFHALSLINEEFGELSAALNDWVYPYGDQSKGKNGNGRERVRCEAIDLINVVLRFLLNLDQMEPCKNLSLDGAIEWECEWCECKEFLPPDSEPPLCTKCKQTMWPILLKRKGIK